MIQGNRTPSLRRSLGSLRQSVESQLSRLTSPIVDPVQFAARNLKIQDKEKRTVPLLYNLAQRTYLKEQSHHDLVLKARQLGLSTCIQGDMFREVLQGPAATATLAHEDAT